MEKINQKLTGSKKNTVSRLIIGFWLILAFLPLRDALGQMSIISDEETEQYLAKVIRPIFQTAGIPFNRNKIYIVNDNSLNAFVGDGNNMANSLIVGAITMGMSCAIACPDEYKPDAEIMKWAEENGNFICSSNILECAKDADILYTDVWASMGQEEEKAEREKVFKDYQINDKVMGVAKDDAMVLHCLPAHREEEITAKVFEEHANEIFDEAENRLHAQKAVMATLMG